MPHYELVSSQGHLDVIHLYGGGVTQVLGVVGKSELDCAHVYKDNTYLFSLQVNGINRDFWTVYVDRQIAAIRREKVSS